MLGRALLRRIVQTGGALGAAAAATLKVFRNFEDRTQDRSIHFSGSLGADAFVSVARTEAPPRDTAARTPGQKEWSAALDFSGPPEEASEAIPQPAFPRFLEARASSPALEKPAPCDGSQRLWTPRVVGLGIAFCLAVAWIGTGSGNPRQPAHEPAYGPAHNPEADAVAEKFARSGSSHATVEYDDGPQYDFGSSSGIFAARFDFAPRLAAFYAEGHDGDDQALTTGSNPSAAIESPIINDAGVIMIRNLPAGSVLSSGTRVSRTDWALAPSDLKSVIVTLPAGWHGGRHAPVKAAIEVYGIAGSPAGTMAVEIREAAARKATGQRRIHAMRAQRARPAAHTAAIKMQKLSPPVQQPAPQSAPLAATQTQPPPSPLNTGAAMALIAKPPTPPPFPQLPFLPGAMNSTPPPASDTTGQQILINLGVVPRSGAESVPEKPEKE